MHSVRRANAETTFATNPVRVLLALVAALLLAGCVATRPAESPQYRDVLPMEAVDQTQGTLTPATGAAGTVDILALSGGGAYGAFGVGVLSAWSERGDRPEFDIVTGVSTGALMSVFAFLGPQYDARLRKLYLDVREADIFTRRGLAGALGDSLYDNTPLKRQIEREVTPDILAAVAAEHARGRRLYVATVNLDSGALVVWDMGDIASGGRSNPLQHFQKVLRASAAVPGFFQPVYIKPQRGVQLRQAHVDGGVKAPVLISDFLFRTPATRRRLFVVINDGLAARDPFEPVEPNVLSIAQKSIMTMTRKLMEDTVYRGYVRARHSSTEFNLLAVPDELALGQTSLSFDARQMRRLYETGRSLMNAPKPFRNAPPRLRNFDVARRR